MRLAIDEISLVRYPPRGGHARVAGYLGLSLGSPAANDRSHAASRLVVFPLGSVPAGR
jgi:hypothetical protein